jgi:hypothetical protein
MSYHDNIKRRYLQSVNIKKRKRRLDRIMIVSVYFALGILFCVAWATFKGWT